MKINITREQLESAIVATIGKKLALKEISGDRAKEIAQMILERLPEDITDEQIKALLPRLDDQIGELSEMVYEIVREEDDKYIAEELPKIRAKIQALIVQTGV